MAPHASDARKPNASSKEASGLLTHEPLAKSSVFDSRVPSHRFQRQLSHSKVGLSGNSPFHAQIRKISPTRERRCRKAVEEAAKGEDVKKLWRHYMDLEGKPLSNRELAQVGHRLCNLLAADLQGATDSGDTEALKKAVAAADGKLQIINLGGMKELKEAKKALEMNPESLPDPYAIAGGGAPAKASTQAQQPVQQKRRSAASATRGSTSLNTTATLEDGDAEEEAAEDEAAEEVEGDEAEEEVEDVEGAEEDAEEEAAEEEDF